MADLVGTIGTGSGRTSITLKALGDGGWEVNVQARWMGDDAPLDVTFACKTTSRASHYDALTITRADVPLPPHPDPLVFELVRVPVQEVDDESFSAVLWLHPQSYFDAGDELPAEEYDVAPSLFRAAAKALEILETPWKLG